MKRASHPLWAERKKKKCPVSQKTVGAWRHKEGGGAKRGKRCGAWGRLSVKSTRLSGWGWQPRKHSQLGDNGLEKGQVVD